MRILHDELCNLLPARKRRNHHTNQVQNENLDDTLAQQK